MGQRGHRSQERSSTDETAIFQDLLDLPSLGSLNLEPDLVLIDSRFPLYLDRVQQRRSEQHETDLDAARSSGRRAEDGVFDVRELDLEDLLRCGCFLAFIDSRGVGAL